MSRKAAFFLFPLAVLLASGAVMASADRVPATTLIVTSTADSGAGSLRDTIAAANDGDTIQFDAALNGQTITLTSGELMLNKSIMISGPGSNLLTVSRSSTAANFRIFHVMPSHIVIIEGLTVTGGNGAPNGSGVLNDHATLTLDSCAVQNNNNPAQSGQGGGIFNDGSGSSATLTIRNSTVSGNSTTMAGGGIVNDGSNGGSPSLTVVDSLVTGNVAEFSEGNGGGICNAGASATLAITNSIVSSNRAGDGAGGFTPFGHGGGIWSSGSATISTSTINDNTAGFGGGISNSGTLTIAGSTVDNNAAVGQQSSSYYGNGGGIENSGALTITNTTLSGNSAKQFGGALYGDGIITNCTISGNTAVIYGGGISGSPAVTNCTISGNQGLSGGGGIHGSPTVTNSTISGNSAQFGNGGGIYGYSGSISNSTISGNSVNFGSGGGIYGGSSISNSTISGNTANQGGGGGIVAVTTVEITNTILKAGASGVNIVNNGGTVTTHGYNISNDNGAGFLTGPGDQINTDPMLGLLQNNGGPTFTHDLLAGSPALDAGNPSFTPPPSTDQRGYARVFNGRIDIGSLEVQPTPPPITISGTISYCSNPVPGPVPNVTLTLTGTSSGSTLSDGSGNYTFSSLPSGGNYTITPTKATRTPGSPNINTVDVIAVQRHFLNLGIPLAGCRLIAADVNSDTSVNTVDVIAIQRFFLGLSTGIANVGRYQFTPVSRTYTAIVGNQNAQNYDTLIFGDVASPFAAP